MTHNLWISSWTHLKELSNEESDFLHKELYYFKSDSGPYVFDEETFKEFKNNIDPEEAKKFADLINIIEKTLKEHDGELDLCLN